MYLQCNFQQFISKNVKKLSNRSHFLSQLQFSAVNVYIHITEQHPEFPALLEKMLKYSDMHSKLRNPRGIETWAYFQESIN